jgi:putative protease
VESQGKEIALTFARHGFDLRNLVQGMPVWKTSDPELEKQWRQTYGGEHPKFTRPIQLTVYGAVDTPLTVIASDELGHTVQVDSQIPLVAATKQPLTTEKLTAQLGRLGNTPFHLATLENHLEGELMLPVSELNQVRRQMVMELERLRAMPKRWTLHSSHSHQELLPDLTQSSKSTQSIGRNIPELIVLVRNIDQLNAAISAEVNTIYCELEDPRRYREMVVNFRQKSRHGQTIWLAPPRICKSGEYWILDQVLRSEPDGYLVRNYDQLKYFADQKCVADFSLNIANALTAKYFKEQYNLVRLTASYDLNVAQVEDLLVSCPQDWLEITIHQHMPMFHMEHCVFCAFLSTGKDFTDCGRPCEKHEVTLRDRSGVSHILQADAGCRNTLFNGTAQTGAEHIQKLQKKGVKYLRLEFLNESAPLVAQTIGAYQQLLRGELTGTQLWQSLKLHNRLGVTRGNL